METLEETTHEIQFLTFFLSEEEYGVNITEVKEIIRFTAITKIPSTPHFIRGVINLRGHVVPVVDLVSKLGLPVSPVTGLTCIVIMEVEHDGKKNLIGIIVDRVNQVINLLPEEIETPPSFGTPIKIEFLGGLGKRESSFVLILATDKILSMEELKSGFSVTPTIEIQPSKGMLP